MDTLEKFTENRPSNIVGLAKEVAQAGLSAGKSLGGYINDLINVIFDGIGRDNN